MSKFSLKNKVNSYNVEDFVEFLKKNELSEFETIARQKSIDGVSFLNLAELEINSWKPLVSIDLSQKFWKFRLRFDQNPENFVYLEKKSSLTSKPSVSRDRLQTLSKNDFLQSLSSVFQQGHSGSQRSTIKNQDGNDSNISVPVGETPNEFNKHPNSEVYEFGQNAEMISDLSNAGMPKNVFEQNRRHSVKPRGGTDSTSNVPVCKPPAQSLKQSNSEFYENDNNEEIKYDLSNAELSKNVLEQTRRHSFKKQGEYERKINVQICERSAQSRKYSNSVIYKNDDNEELTYDSPSDISRRVPDEHIKHVIQNEGDNGKKIIAPIRISPAPSSKHLNSEFYENDDDGEVKYDSPSRIPRKVGEEHIKHVVQRQYDNMKLVAPFHQLSAPSSKHPNSDFYEYDDNEEVKYDSPSRIPRKVLDENIKHSVESQIANAKNNIVPIHEVPVRLTKQPCFECYKSRHNEQVLYDSPSGMPRMVLGEHKKHLFQDQAGNERNIVVPIRKIPTRSFKQPNSEFYESDNIDQVMYDSPSEMPRKVLGEHIKHLVQNQSGNERKIVVPIQSSKQPYSEFYDSGNNEEVLYDLPSEAHRKVNKENIKQFVKNKTRSDMKIILPIYKISAQSSKQPYSELYESDDNDDELYDSPCSSTKEPYSELCESDHNEEVIYDSPVGEVSRNHFEEHVKQLFHDQAESERKLFLPTPEVFARSTKQPSSKFYGNENDAKFIYDSTNSQIDVNTAWSQFVHKMQKPLPKLDPMLLDQVHLYEDIIDVNPEVEAVRQEIHDERKFFSLRRHRNKQGEQKKQINQTPPIIQSSPLPPIPTITNRNTMSSNMEERTLAARCNNLPRPPKNLPKFEILDFPIDIEARSLEEESYYRNMSRQAAEKLLSDPSIIDGTYMARPHKVYHCTLSVKWGDKVYHIRVKNVEDNMLEIDSSSSDLKFRTISEIIEYTKTNPLPVMNKYNNVIDIYLFRSV